MTIGAKIGNSDQYSEEEATRRMNEALRRALTSPPKPHSAMKVGKRKAEASTKASRPEAPDGVMIVYDVQALPNGEVVIGKPYRRFPDGSVASLIAS
jgi:hypothetical protein